MQSSRLYKDGKLVSASKPAPKPTAQLVYLTHHTDSVRALEIEDLRKEVIAWRNIALAYKYDKETNSITLR